MGDKRGLRLIHVHMLASTNTQNTFISRILVTSFIVQSEVYLVVSSRSPSTMGNWLSFSISPADLFIVPRSLSTAWSTETVHSTASQVVTPPVQGFHATSSLVRGHPLITLALVTTSRSSLSSLLPRFLFLVRYKCSHGSRATNSSNAIVWLPISYPVVLSFSAQPSFVILVSSLFISLYKIMLFFLIHT